MEKPETLFDVLSAYCPGVLPMHMPGHKRNTALSGDSGYLAALGAGLDITEIDGFDDLHDAHGILLSGMERMARLWGSKHAYFVVNGSTCGVLAAVHAALLPGDEVICARNCHKSVYSALALRRVTTHFILPETESFTGTSCILSPEMVASALDRFPKSRAVILTSPSYEGVICDVAAICAAAHARGAAVIVDEAHGAHLGFGHGFPDGSIKCGADIVIHSLHKTLPSLTQTAAVHLSGALVNPKRLSGALSIFETSSPSYLLMASIDGCTALLERHGELFDAWQHGLELFYNETAGLRHLSLMDSSPNIFARDPGKLVVSTRGTRLDGPGLMSLLRSDYGIELEMAARDYVVAMTGMGDTDASLLRFASALLQIDSSLTAADSAVLPPPFLPDVFCQAYETEGQEFCAVAPEAAIGRISAEYVWAYPPGIPLIIPGEVIGSELIRQMESYKSASIRLKSSFGALPHKIYVLKSAALS